MPDIELIYYGIHGRALLARMLFQLGNVDFKDTQQTMEDFLKVKPSRSRSIMNILGQHYI